MNTKWILALCLLCMTHSSFAATVCVDLSRFCPTCTGAGYGVSIKPISVRGPTDPTTLTGLTDASGQVIFYRLPQGTYSLILRGAPVPELLLTVPDSDGSFDADALATGNWTRPAAHILSGVTFRGSTNVFQFTNGVVAGMTLTTDGSNWFAVTASSGGDAVWTNSDGVIQTVLYGTNFLYRENGFGDNRLYQQANGTNGTSYIQHSTYNDGAYVESTVSIGIGTNAVSGDSQIVFDIGQDFIDTRWTYYGINLVRFNPTSGSSATPYSFNTSEFHDSGFFLEAANFDTNIFSVSHDGALTAGNPGSGEAAWKLGKVITGSSVTLTLTNYVEVMIGGVLKKLALAQ